MEKITQSGQVIELQQNIQNFVYDFTVEITPFSAKKISNFQKILKPATTVYVTFLPGTDFRETIKTVKRLKHEGFNPVPHIVARSILNRNNLDDAINQLTGEFGVQEVLCLAGAVKNPLGEFTNSMDLLETGIFDKYNIKKIGVAGHPEGSPGISDQNIAHALSWKNKFNDRTDSALYIITQFCFDPEPIIAWDKKIKASGNVLPIRIGVPGIASLKALLGYAKSCGVGESINFLKRQARNVTKLLKASTPDKQITALSRYKTTDKSCGITGIHMYPLGGLEKSVDWAYAVADGKFKISNSQDGFSIHK